MSQVYDSLSVPQGFQAAGTYSGLCSSRVKLDVAMIVSRRDCSIVTARYRVGDNSSGTLGIIGPTRMNYNRVISVLDFMGRAVSEVLSERK